MDYWKSPPAKLLRKYYFFDVQNPNEFRFGKQKPILVERGPYTYSQVNNIQTNSNSYRLLTNFTFSNLKKTTKTNITFSGPDYVTYNPIVTLYFEPDLSNGSEDDIITFLNIPAVV